MLTPSCRRRRFPPPRRFSGAGVKIDGAPGSLATLELPPAAVGHESAVSVTLHGPVASGGAQLQGYTVHVTRAAAPGADVGEVVRVDHSAAMAEPTAGHGHSHNGVPCAHDHGHGHGKPAAAAHGHDHGHGHAHGEPKAAVEHGHSHGGVPCTDASHDHGHGHGAHQAHGHAHAHDHGHSHGAHGHAHHGDEDDDNDASAALMRAMSGGGPPGGDGADGTWIRPPGACYAWAQDGDSITVEIGVPPTTKGKDVKVVIGAAQLEVSVAGAADVSISSPLGGRVARGDSSWSLVDEGGKRLLVLTLAKEGGDRAPAWHSLLAPGAL